MFTASPKDNQGIIRGQTSSGGELWRN